ncbi:MAG: hypothetical protein N7Q72_04550 [Spiroplasma sp. Tabriz.8]|nr:hypothetical protein [Spiroplasma sp. Tabriz.8]
MSIGLMDCRGRNDITRWYIYIYIYIYIITLPRIFTLLDERKSVPKY